MKEVTAGSELPLPIGEDAKDCKCISPPFFVYGIVVFTPYLSEYWLMGSTELLDVRVIMRMYHFA